MDDGDDDDGEDDDGDENDDDNDDEDDDDDDSKGYSETKTFKGYCCWLLSLDLGVARFAVASIVPLIIILKNLILGFIQDLIILIARHPNQYKKRNNKSNSLFLSRSDYFDCRVAKSLLKYVIQSKILGLV